MFLKGFPGGSDSKESACQCRRRGFNPWVGKIPWRRKWQLIPVFLSGKSQGQRSKAIAKESDPTQQLTNNKCLSIAQTESSSHVKEISPLFYYLEIITIKICFCYCFSMHGHQPYNIFCLILNLFCVHKYSPTLPRWCQW